MKAEKEDTGLKLYLVLRPIALGARVEAGTQVQLTKAEANNYPPDFLKEIKPEVKAEVVAPADSGDADSLTEKTESSSTGNAGDQPQTVDHIVTQDDLDSDPNLAATGVTVGQTIQIPAV